MANEKHSRPRQEEDRVRSPLIVLVGVVGLLAFLVGIRWAVHIQRGAGGAVHSSRVTTPPPLAGRLEVGIVYQPPFDSDHSISAAKRERQETRLHSFGWIDKERQIVFIPIDRAMERLVQGGKL